MSSACSRPTGQPDRSIGDAEFGTIFRLQALMRRRRRMRHDALGIAEVVADLRKPERVQELERGGFAARNIERDHGRTTTHLFLDDGCMRMIRARPGVQINLVMFACLARTSATLAALSVCRATLSDMQRSQVP